MSFLTTEQGHIDLAVLALNNNSFWLARGTLPQNYKGAWDDGPVPTALNMVVSEEEVTRDSEILADPLSTTPVFDIIEVKSTDGTAVYTEGVSFSLQGNNIVWDPEEPMPEPGETYLVTYRYVYENVTELLSEVDTMRASVASYCYPDENGLIEAGGQKWSATTTPSKYVYLYFKYPAEISLGTKIYQLGVFTNRTLLNDTNEATLTSNVDDTGHLIFIDNIPPFTQIELVRQYVEIVLEF